MDISGIGTVISGALDTVADKFFVDAKDKQEFKSLRHGSCLPWLFFVEDHILKNMILNVFCG